MDRTNADDAEFDRVFFPADHALHIDDEAGRNQYGINRQLRAPSRDRRGPWNVMARLLEMDDPIPTR